MSTSLTDDFFPDTSDLILESFDRIGVRPTSLTRQHMISATRSVNFELQRWGNLGVHLWEVSLETIPLTQGVGTYTLPSNTVSLLSAYRRTYQLTNTSNITPSFSTIAGSSSVTVNQVNSGLQTGNWLQVVIPVSVGGIILFGYYAVTSVISGTQYTITSVGNATSTVTNSGVVPSFSITDGSATTTCTLPSHGLGVGQTFIVQVPTTVGNVVLQGSYVIATVPDVNTFTFAAQFPATLTQTGVLENVGLCQINTQSTTADPIDQFMQPIGRDEYASYADKFSQSPPTVYWFNRQSPIPNVTVWEVPDGAGPYAFMYYRMKRVQDASASGGQTADIPYLFLDALCANVAYRLARKYAPALCPQLMVEAKNALDEAMTENREYVDIMIMPQLSNYWRI